MYCDCGNKGEHDQCGKDVRITAVTVCVNYGDILTWTLPNLVRAFDKVLVLTTPRDEQTKAVCEYHNVEYLATEAFYENDAAFDKSRAINEGLRKLNVKDFGAHDWLAHVDADIVIPPRAHELFRRIHLQNDCIYGIDRLLCIGFEKYIKFLQFPEVQHERQIFVAAQSFPLGIRVARQLDDGYVPIGFFQLWNPQGSDRRTYTEGLRSAGANDMRFALQWPRWKRHLIPEIVGIHLESEAKKMGSNWRGRTSKPFSHEDIDNADWRTPVPDYKLLK